MSFRKVLVCLTVLGLVCGLATSVFAGPGAEDQIKTLKEQVAALNQKVDQLSGQMQESDKAVSNATLEKRVRELEARMTERAADEAVFTAGWKDGFKIKSSDGQHELRIGALVQADGVWTVGDPGFKDSSNDGFVMRRVRLILDGKVYKYFEFYLEAGFEQPFEPDYLSDVYFYDDGYGESFGYCETQCRGGIGGILKDAYMNVNMCPAIQFQVGLFKAPISHEDLQHSAWIHLPERSLMNNLLPDREVGIMFHGKPIEWLEYQVAWVNGADISAVDNDDEEEVIVRAMLTPLAATKNEWFNDMSVGGFWAWSNQQGNTRPCGYKTSSGQSFLAWNSLARLDDERMRYGAALKWYAKFLHLNAEWMRLEQDVSVPAFFVGDDPLLSRQNIQTESWYVQAGVVLTGEDASYTGVKPKKNFDPRKGGWGAFELVLRYSNLNIEDEAIKLNDEDMAYACGSDTADAYAVGLNWYMNPAVKFMIMYEHVAFSKDLEYLGADFVEEQKNAADAEDVIMFRFQVKI